MASTNTVEGSSNPLGATGLTVTASRFGRFSTQSLPPLLWKSRSVIGETNILVKSFTTTAHPYASGCIFRKFSIMSVRMPLMNSWLP